MVSSVLPVFMILGIVLAPGFIFVVVAYCRSSASRTRQREIIQARMERAAHDRRHRMRMSQTVDRNDLWESWVDLRCTTDLDCPGVEDWKVSTYIKLPCELCTHWRMLAYFSGYNVAQHQLDAKALQRDTRDGSCSLRFLSTRKGHRLPSSGVGHDLHIIHGPLEGKRPLPIEAMPCSKRSS